MAMPLSRRCQTDILGPREWEWHVLKPLPTARGSRTPALPQIMEIGNGARSALAQREVRDQES